MTQVDTKQQILEAAGRVVLARGVTGLTLEAVAEEAGLSKGGLLYHYGSKEALLTAMVGRLVEVTEERIDAHRQSDSAPGSWTRGYLQACLTDGIPATDPTGRLAVALLAAGATDPAQLDEVRERQEVWQARLHEDGVDPVMANIVRLAADGLWMNDIFGIPALSKDERAELLARLEALTRQ
ncbi:TetR/AcrR family transcriptional regulator [Ferruginivarius sediminum]|uniref:TetR/AcrR family transcriptional regulator n=1 Tax=Ferruginivarius sediminum TaxID=2661937 RepID=A0A369T7N5_9PROT|nr:TetR/AcrR family transcriptional regulator [Ferruginivarius sediminum]RDD60365.1 TetR/AcrR family transcriptional regulator [Ferruginivarius sediminum]